MWINEFCEKSGTTYAPTPFVMDALRMHNPFMPPLEMNEDRAILTFPSSVANVKETPPHLGAFLTRPSRRNIGVVHLFS